MTTTIPDPTGPTAMTLSEIAYSEPRYIPRQLAYPGYATKGRWRLTWLGVTDGNQMYVATNGNIWVIAIRGSATDPLQYDFWIDWFEEDFTALHQVELPFGNVQNALISWGTKTGLDDLLGMTYGGLTLAQYVAQLPLAPGKLWVTGHSLGGCLASVLAPYLYEAVCRARGLPSSCIVPITFAAPTAGNGAFAAYVDGLFAPHARRYHNTLDVIPHAWSLEGVDWILGSFPAPGPYLHRDPVLYSAVDLTWRFLYEWSYDYQQPTGDGTRLEGTLTARDLWAFEAGDQHSGQRYLQLLRSPTVIFPYPPAVTTALGEHEIEARAQARREVRKIREL